MRIGLLICDNLTEDIRKAYGEYAQMFRQLLQMSEPDIATEVFDVTNGSYPASLKDCDAYLMTGSRSGVNDDAPWVTELERFTRSLWAARHKTIGVCFGHQMIAKALGGEVQISSNGWGLGIDALDILTQQAWMQPPMDRVKIYISHQEQITHLPEQAQVLASTARCPYGMLQYEEAFLSMQGHPEFYKAFSRMLIEKRKALLPAEVYQSSLASLQGEANKSLLSTWMLSFLHARP